MTPDSPAELDSGTLREFEPAPSHDGRTGLGALARAPRALGAGRWLALLLVLLLVPTTGRAQQPMDDVFGGFGTSSTVEEGDSPAEQRAGEGTVRGRVFDGETGQPVMRATVILVHPEDDAGQRKQEVATSDFDGAFEFASVPAGTYELTFIKSGYRTSTMTDFEVQEGEVNRADFPIPPVPAEMSGQVLQLDAFVVEASTVSEMMTSLEMRLDSDALLNTFSAEDFSRFAAGDVAEALKRVAGVNVVEGQFAVIRGLEDRYSSTLYNSAVVPSPDPDRQSVQLDLFPSEVVSNLAISKSFTPDLPSNSSGGSIDIQTTGFPEIFEIKVNAATGFNDKAIDNFLQYEENNPFGRKRDGEDVLTQEYGVSFGGREEFWARDFRLKGVFNYEVDYDTAEGFRHRREPRLTERQVIGGAGVVQSGDLSLGELNLSGGRFDLTESDKEEQMTFWGGFGFDLDEDALHRIDFSYFYTDKETEFVQLEERGYIPDFDYGELRAKTIAGQSVSQADFDGFATNGSWITDLRQDVEQDSPSRGVLWYGSFQDGLSQKIERDMMITQLNGDHTFDFLDGLEFSWAGNYAETEQDDDTFGSEIWYEPCGVNQFAPDCPDGFVRDPNDIPTSFPVAPNALGPGIWFTSNGGLQNSNDIKEEQWFARGDFDYERSLVDEVRANLRAGGWYENADRDVDSVVLIDPVVDGTTQILIEGDSPFELGELTWSGRNGGYDQDPDGTFTGSRKSTNQSEREIAAGYFSTKLTFFEDIDVLGGLRVEQIEIKSDNDPFVDPPFDEIDGSPLIFPSKYLLFDRLDNPRRNEVAAARESDVVWNDEIIGIDVPVDTSTDVCDPPDDPDEERGCVDLPTREDIESFVNGKIDETKVLPAAGLTYRPIEGLTIRGAYSQTVARPSFREMGYYVSVEPRSDNLVIGNPQLELSDVESWDGRIEYVWSDSGDLLAFSGFHKKIEDPIESIILQVKNDFSARNESLFKTFFNNENTARLWGIEIEGRKNLEFLDEFFGTHFLRYFTVGGNYTYIDAEVKRSDAERSRFDPFFGVADGDEERISRYKRKRRLFGQPEWIANADVTFDKPEWGTTITLAYFAISDVLDAAGTTVENQAGEILSGTLDRYVDEFDQLDLIASQQFVLPRNLGVLTLKGQAKNLTNSRRKLVYDTEQTRRDVTEKSVKIGRDFKFSLTYSVSF